MVNCCIVLPYIHICYIPIEITTGILRKKHNNIIFGTQEIEKLSSIRDHHQLCVRNYATVYSFTLKRSSPLTIIIPASSFLCRTPPSDLLIQFLYCCNHCAILERYPIIPTLWIRGVPLNYIL